MDKEFERSGSVCNNCNNKCENIYYKCTICFSCIVCSDCIDNFESSHFHPFTRMNIQNKKKLSPFIKEENEVPYEHRPTRMAVSENGRFVYKPIAYSNDSKETESANQQVGTYMAQQMNGRNSYKPNRTGFMAEHINGKNGYNNYNPK